MESNNIFAKVNKKRGPATEDGLRNISIANSKTGLWTRQAKADKRNCRELLRDGQVMLEEAQKALYSTTMH